MPLSINTIGPDAHKPAGCKLPGSTWRWPWCRHGAERARKSMTRTQFKTKSRGALRGTLSYWTPVRSSKSRQSVEHF
ncbi:hypothetical protein CEXT_234851 [Caerostris extrusa]|uniref:Uncharacterized protein n=1 Tax=Caerostris extrusa TaxID=172846 RepID=A0AAV4VTF6_CAEEX|nr:hypothetical protein CEXT_234851 [Caerostris extrusa]